MQFRSRRATEPEINLIPLIDVLLVVIIFLMLSTTYARFTELKIRLPSASASAVTTEPAEVPVFIDANGNYAIGDGLYHFVDQAGLRNALRTIMQGQEDAVLVIYADAATPHQAVVLVMDEARKAAMTRITFAAKSESSKMALDDRLAPAQP